MRGVLVRGAAVAALMSLFAFPAFAQSRNEAGDVGDAAANAGRIAPGESVISALAPAGDKDWWQVTLRGGQGYRITLDSPEGENSFDPMLRLIGANGAEIASNDDAGGALNSRIDIAAPADGVYYIEARGFGDDAAGAYTLGIVERAVPTDSIRGDAQTNARLAIGTPVNNAVDFDGDVDWYRVDVRAGNIYHITLNSTGGEGAGLPDPFLRVVNGEGDELISNDDGGQGGEAGSLDSALDFVPPASGVYYVEARNLNTDSGAGAYRLSMERRVLPADPVRGDTQTRSRIAIGSNVNGALDFPRDTDWYRVSLTGGQSYRFALSGSGENALDPLLVLHDSAGAEIARDDDSGDGLNAYLEFEAPRTGTYFLEARGFADEAQGRYELRTARGDIPGDATTDVALDMTGDFRESRLAAGGDKDWYALNLTDGQTVRLQLSKSSMNAPLSDPLLVVYNSEGQEVARDDDGGGDLNAYLEFTPPSPGRYFVEARGFGEDAEGAYAIQLSPGEIGNDASGAEGLPGGMQRMSQISTAGDSDWFAIEMTEGRPYRVFLDAAEGEGALGDPMLVLYDGEGKELKRDDDGGKGDNAVISFTPLQTGMYYAAASGSGGTETGRYVIRAADYEMPGNAGTDDMLDAAEDSRAGRIDMPGDKDWYGVELANGGTYRITVSGEGEHGLRDPGVAVMRINMGGHDHMAEAPDGAEAPSDEPVAQAQNGMFGRSASLTYTVPEDGAYYVQVTGKDGVGDYSLNVTRVDNQ